MRLALVAFYDMFVGASTDPTVDLNGGPGISGPAILEHNVTADDGKGSLSWNAAYLAASDAGLFDDGGTLLDARAFVHCFRFRQDGSR